MTSAPVGNERHDESVYFPIQLAGHSVMRSASHQKHDIDSFHIDCLDISSSGVSKASHMTVHVKGDAKKQKKTDAPKGSIQADQD